CECELSAVKRDLVDLAPGCLRQKNVQLDVPTRPGLGIEIEWDAVKRLRV
ncbi:mandelate racemase/muconate lactonizing enzyme family protein, partial [Rhizobium ruizarguesonis]